MLNLKEGFIVCDSNIKKNIILESEGFNNYIFLSYGELINKVLGSASNESELVLVEHYGFSYDQALEILEYLPFIKNIHYNNPKLDSLVTIKEYLKANGLYKENNLFKSRLTQYPVTFIYPEYNNITKLLISEVKKYTDTYFIDSDSKVYNHEVYHFQTRTEECLFIMNRITDLLKSGVDINKIILNNIDSSYEFILKRMSKSYGIPIRFKKKTNILSTDFATKLLFELSDNNTFDEVLLKLDNESPYFNKIIDIINNYKIKNKCPKDMYDFFKKKLKNMSFENLEYKNAVRVSNSLKYNDDEHVFFLGFNLGNAPKAFKDDKYLSDSELSFLGLDTSYDRNVYARNSLVSFIKHTKNLYISYKDTDSKDDYEPSTLINELDLEVVNPVINVGYAKLEDDLRIATAYDALLKYKTKSSMLDYDIHHIKYNLYDNKYKGISKELLDERFSEKMLNLSYSSMKTYLACPFSYFADRILYLNEFIPNMAARLGSYSHGILEDSYKSDFDFNESVINRTNEYAEDAKDRFYFDKMVDTLRSLVNFNRANEGLSELNNVKMEPHITYDGDGFLFEGYVDKLLYTIVDDEVYAVIIDYKTGKDIVSLDNIEDGFNLQLPSYVFLLSRYEPFKNKKINVIGIYLQKVNMIALKWEDDIDKQRDKSFMLQGYTINEYALVNMFDKSYNQSLYISGMKTLKDGTFSKNTKLINRDDVDMLRDLIETTINLTASNIKNGNFIIAPKEIDGKNQSCTFCKYKDLCFKTLDDVISLPKKPFGAKEEE
jgi:ATP-dependent helicase/DNAse subunit B